MSIKEIVTAFPAPWNRITHPNGLIQVVDAAGKEVPLLTLLDFAQQCMTHLARPVAEAPVAA